ncbi:Zn(2)-C6 fungal-type domain-containing protein [Mycena venus]|uniref:Zn(2)-C6 fungal-type domain-containing protein n=1 Tax=Mycena venus TaxID=2733690 RepID=A0A8H6XIV5_9AGAR|nr:Zn(2)-C6 fungal-type domain-containing protein [Mycena venus]
MSRVPELNTVITTMGERIRQLQNALISAGIPPAKQRLFLTTDTQHLSESTPAQRGDVMGSFCVNEDGDAIYFGPTAGCAALSSIEANSRGYSATERFLFTAITESFPFSTNQTPSWDADLAAEQLLAHLPLETRAWNLCDIYYRNGCWAGMPVMQSETVELLSLIYHNIAREGASERIATTQQITVLYLIFALGALVDLDLPAYNSEAEQYFDLASGAMSVNSLFADPTVATTQALTLFACYYSHGGPRFSMDAAWTLISLASQMSQRLGLQKAPVQSYRSNYAIDIGQALFWETYTIETTYGLSVGRPTGTLLSDITCPFPPDEDEDAQQFIVTLAGDIQKKIAAPIMEKVTTTSRPSYKAILEMDKTMRTHMHSCPCERFPTLEDEPPAAYAQRHLLSLFSKFQIMYIHSGSFIEAIRDEPTNPFASSYMHSFAAAYITALGIIETHKRNFAAHPALFTRWWPARESLFNAALIAGTFAARYPTSKPRHPRALLGLFTAVDLMDKMTESGGRAGSSLTIVRRLLDKAIAMHLQVNSGPDSTPPPHTDDPEIERDLEIFAGHTCVVERVTQVENGGSSELPEQTTEPEIWLQDPESLIGQFFDPALAFSHVTSLSDLQGTDFSGDAGPFPDAPIFTPHSFLVTHPQHPPSWTDFLPGL